MQGQLEEGYVSRQIQEQLKTDVRAPVSLLWAQIQATDSTKAIFPAKWICHLELLI